MAKLTLYAQLQKCLTDVRSGLSRSNSLLLVLTGWTECMEAGNTIPILATEYEAIRRGTNGSFSGLSGAVHTIEYDIAQPSFVRVLLDGKNFLVAREKSTTPVSYEMESLTNWTDFDEGEINQCISTLSDSLIGSTCLERAVQLVLNGSYTPANLNAALSQYINGGGDVAKDVYEYFVAGISQAAPLTSLAAVLRTLYGDVESSASVDENNNTLTFNTNDYTVKAVLFPTASVVQLASALLSGILTAIFGFAGAAIGAVIGGVVNFITGVVSENVGLSASFNVGAPTLSFAQPIMQVSNDASLRALPVLEKGLATVTGSSLTSYLWKNNDDATVSREVYLNAVGCPVKPSYDLTDSSWDFINSLVDVTWSQEMISGLTYKSVDGPNSSFSAYYRKVADEGILCSPTLSESENCQILGTNLLILCLSVLCPRYPQGGYSIDTFAGRPVGFVASKLIAGLSSGNITYAEIVSYMQQVLPILSNLPISGSERYTRTTPLLLHDIDTIYDAYSIEFDEITDKDSFYLTPPSYAPGALSRGLLATAFVAAATAATALIISNSCKRWINRRMTDKFNVVQEKRNAYINRVHSGSNADTAFAEYYAATRSYNRWATLTGSSRMAVNGQWNTTVSGNEDMLSSITKASQDSASIAEILTEFEERLTLKLQSVRELISVE